MGCDIHFHTEVKINGQWEHKGHPDIGRNYPLFALLANVRNNGNTTPISEPRGLPNDASVLTKFISDKYGSDGHSHSYIVSNEMVQLEEFIKDQIEDGWFGERRSSSVSYPENLLGYLMGHSWSDFYLHRTSIPEEIEDVRFVFWFDN